MAETQPVSILRPKLDKMMKAAKKHKKKMENLARTKAIAFYSSRLKKIDANSAKIAKKEAEIAALEKKNAALYATLSEAYYDDREKYEGFLNSDDFGDLF